jgi:uncharacterized DUF497 family protein
LVGKEFGRGAQKQNKEITKSDPISPLSLQNRLLVVSHTQRADRTRIISARLMDRKERTIYEEG